MTEPPSRQYEAYKANGWPNQVAEYDPHGVAAGGMYADCDGCRSRDWFGPNPWSEPGSAKHLGRGLPHEDTYLRQRVGHVVV